MGTHPIFESDFDCLTEVKSAEMAKAPQKSKEAKAKAASGGGKKSNRQKWPRHRKSRKRQRPKRLPEAERSPKRSGPRERSETSCRTCVSSTNPPTTRSSRKCPTTS